MKDEILFSLFLVRITNPLPAAEFAVVALDVRDQRQLEEAIPFNIASMGVEKWAAECVKHGQKLQSFGPPSHIGGR